MGKPGFYNLLTMVYSSLVSMSQVLAQQIMIKIKHDLELYVNPSIYFRMRLEKDLQSVGPRNIIYNCDGVSIFIVFNTAKRMEGKNN